jgi:hypothetical protein
MNQIVQPINSEARNTVEIVVHVTEGLDEDQRNDLVSALKNTNGITGAEFCPLRYHLMLVRYDTNLFSSQDVLRSVSEQDIHARLIGPV